MGCYIGTADSYNNGDGSFLTFFGVCIFLMGIAGACWVCVDYVKFGSRKKLAAVGYKSSLGKIASSAVETIGSTGSSSSIDSSEA